MAANWSTLTLYMDVTFPLMLMQMYAFSPAATEAPPWPYTGGSHAAKG